MNYFLDCGYYVGKALEYYAPFLDRDWQIVAFEPNEDLDVEETSKRFLQYCDFTWIPSAVWTEDGFVDFWISKNNSASFIDGISENAPDKKISVPCFDFSKFVAEYPKDSKIVCSMDIEGAEFPVLEKMLKDGTMGRISLLDIEFHHRLLPDKTAEDAEALIREIQGAGTLVKVKVGL